MAGFLKYKKNVRTKSEAFLVFCINNSVKYDSSDSFDLPYLKLQSKTIILDQQLPV